MEYVLRFTMDRDEHGNTGSSYLLQDLRKLKGVQSFRSAQQSGVVIQIIVDKKSLIPKVMKVLKENSQTSWVEKGWFHPV